MTDPSLTSTTRTTMPPWVSRMGYYAELDAGAAKDVRREHDIAALWDEAAIHAETIDSVMANRLGLKSRYWREGAAWSDEKIADAKIGLEKINWDARVLTAPKQRH